MLQKTPLVRYRRSSELVRTIASVSTLILVFMTILFVALFVLAPAFRMIAWPFALMLAVALGIRLLKRPFRLPREATASDDMIKEIKKKTADTRE